MLHVVCKRTMGMMFKKRQLWPFCFVARTAAMILCSYHYVATYLCILVRCYVVTEKAKVATVGPDQSG